MTSEQIRKELLEIADIINGIVAGDSGYTEKQIRIIESNNKKFERLICQLRVTEDIELMRCQTSELYCTGEIFLLWDKLNDSPEILGEDGEFYFYSEDNVVIARGGEGGRFWTKLNKFTDVTPLNNCDRFDIFDPLENDWVPLISARDELVSEMHKYAGDPEWKDIL